MSRLFLFLPLAVAAVWFVRRYRDGSFRRFRDQGRAAAQPSPAEQPAPAWVYTPEEYGMLPDAELDTQLPGPDPQLTQALSAADTGDWRPAAALLAGSDPEWRWRRLVTLARKAAEEDGWLRSWSAALPGDPTAALVTAESTVQLAWLLRGGKKAHSTTQEQFVNFHQVLGRAPAAFAEAARLAPADPAPYIGLISVAKAEGWPHDRMRALWAEITARAPYHVRAHTDALQYWCAKWQGSHELMHSFAETAAANAPAGSLLPMLRLIAWYEEMIEQNAEQHDYRSPQLTAAIDALLADTALASPHHAALPAARHLLVYFLRGQRRFLEAREQLRLVDGWIGALPWGYATDRTAFYASVRKQIVLAASHQEREAQQQAT
ncbi:hypothetical protein ACWD5Q_02105 [Streptomyces sp. NPDC002513]